MTARFIPEQYKINSRPSSWGTKKLNHFWHILFLGHKGEYVMTNKGCDQEQNYIYKKHLNMQENNPEYIKQKGGYGGEKIHP
jgi:hypothetical protein